MTQERWKNGASTIRTIGLTYDLAGRMTAANDDGTNARVFGYLYDELSRVDQIKWSVGTTEFNLKSVFDDLSR